jgi:protein-S-isoprenylcysteine O-methyltransferase Ste14
VGEVRAAVAVLLFLGGIGWKIGLEERWMEGEFGDRYRDYRAKVKALIPFVH